MPKSRDFDFSIFRSNWDAVQYCALAGIPGKQSGKEIVAAFPFQGRDNPPTTCAITFTIETDGKTVKQGGKAYKRIKVLILQPPASSQKQSLDIAQDGAAFLKYITEEIGALHEDPRVSYSNRRFNKAVRFPASFLIEWVE